MCFFCRKRKSRKGTAAAVPFRFSKREINKSLLQRAPARFGQRTAVLDGQAGDHHNIFGVKKRELYFRGHIRFFHLSYPLSPLRIARIKTGRGSGQTRFFDPGLCTGRDPRMPSIQKVFTQDRLRHHYTQKKKKVKSFLYNSPNFRFFTPGLSKKPLPFPHRPKTQSPP